MMWPLFLLAVGVLAPSCHAQWDFQPELPSCNSTCIGNDNTSLPEDLLHRYRTCSCDADCAAYGDCCSDNPAIKQQRQIWSCFRYNEQQDGILVQQICMSDWEGDGNILRQCESPADPVTDPHLQAPATSSASGVSYRNIFCAICNNDYETAKPWIPDMQCDDVFIAPDINETYIRENLELHAGKWGLWLDVDDERDFYTCDLKYKAPKVNASYNCVPVVDTCDPSWSGSETEVQCKSHTIKVHSDGITYRNNHCAICNNVTYPINCGPAGSGLKGRLFSFSVLMDVNPKSGNIVGKVELCGETEVYDPFYKKCRNIVCGTPGYVLEGKHCVLHDESRLRTFLRSGAYDDSGGRVVMSDEFLNCTHTHLEQDEYMLRPSGHMYALRYDKDFKPQDFHIQTDNRAMVCAFFINTSNEITKFSPYMGYASAIGLGISISCLVVHLFIFAVVPEVRNLSGKNLAHLSVALLAAYISFIMGQLTHLRFVPCRALAIIAYYFFTASFFWTNAMAYDVWRTLRAATRELRVGSGSQWKRHLVYMFYSWSIPAIIIGTAVFFDEPSNGFPREYRPAFGRHSCWFGQRKALLVFFAGPAAVVTIVNMILFVSTAIMIIGSTKSASKNSSGTARRNFGLYFRLSVMMGLSWSFGLAAGYLDLDVLWYLFIIFNTLEGLFIFIAFSCTSKVGGYLQDSILTCFKMKPERNATLSSGSGYNSQSTGSTQLSRRSTPRNSTNYKRTAPYLAPGKRGIASLDMH
ncbi:uncharacterized protein LOC135391469 [Ornithodoros turicata]|uniref:uncharacterized protein LOC135391469 n=1 Tax=Ornithodoros turicata TaxID=34597 RepID=UPI00313996ED